MSKLLILITVLLFSGCSLHYMNEKGIKAKADDININGASLEDTNGYFHSTLEILFGSAIRTETICLQCLEPGQCMEVDCE